MKGLLLKDLYLVSKYCRSFVLILVIFLGVSCFGQVNTFYVIYPVLIAGIIPVTLISYDEREKWTMYSATLPYTRAQLVSAKYLIGLLFELVIFVLSSVLQVFRMNRGGGFAVSEYLPFVLTIFIIGLVGPSVLLPFIFRFGAEKGRIAYYVVIGALCAGGTVLSGSGMQGNNYLFSGRLLGFIAIAAVALYAFSWGLSILFYQKREL